MLEPERRVVLLDQLRPPAGHSLAAAVGTTFTLDLRSALVAPLAFTTLSNTHAGDPLATLESVRSTADRVDIFCQAGQIVVPRGHNDLMAFLEPLVHQVTPAKPGFLFHPKVWLMKFVSDDGEARFRLICSSRNLVESNAWDASVTLDGGPVDSPQPVNAPLTAFLRHLPTRVVGGLERTRAARVEHLADEVARVKWDAPAPFGAVTFHAWGIPGEAATATFTGTRQAVVAPFLDAVGFTHVAPNVNDRTLISRQEALAAMPHEMLPQGGTFVLDPLARWESRDDAAPQTDPIVPEVERSGLHAKLFLVERNRGEAHLYVGSPNATGAAFSGNVEFAVELVGRSKTVGVEKLLGRDAGLRQMLQEYAPADAPLLPDDSADHEVRNVLRSAASRQFTLRVRKEHDGYRLALRSDKPLTLPEEFTAAASLLTIPAQLRDITTSVMATFGPVPLADITPFLVLTVTGSDGVSAASVVVATLLEDPNGRLDAVLARQVDTPQKFIRLLQLILSLDDTHLGWNEMSVGLGAPLSGRGGVGLAEPAVLESLVRALASNPRAAHSLDELVTRLSRTAAGAAVLPPGFDQLWRQFKQAQSRLEDAR